MKMSFGKLLLLMWLWHFASLCSYAGILKGTVKDDKGEIIPFALIYVEGTSIGTTGNAQGEYHLELGSGNHVVKCQSIGYQTSSYTVSIKQSETITHHFILKDQGLSLKEVTVRATDEDPGMRIMRKAIKKRKEHLQQVKSFQTDIYLKGVVRTTDAPEKIFGQKVEKGDLGLDTGGKGVLYLVEQFATYYARPDGKTKTFIHSVKESGSPDGTGLSSIPEVVSFYENNINLLPESNPRGFISPLNDLAFTYYRFKLLGTFQQHNKNIYKISVVPKRDFEPCFRGSVFIADDDWAIQSLSLQLDKRSDLNLLDTLVLTQQYLPKEKGIWVIKQQVIYPKIKIFGFNLSGHLLTVYNKQQVNKSIPDSIFKDKYLSVYDDNANKKDSTFWNSNRPITLEEDEQKDYLIKDSLYTRANDPKYIDSMRKKGNRLKDPFSLLLNGYTYRFKQNKSYLSLEPLLYSINYNTVEGINVAPQFAYYTRLDTSSSLSARAAVRYGFSNTHLNSIASITYRKNKIDYPSKNFTLTVQGGKYVFQYSGFRQVPELFNTYATLLNGQNYLKLYERIHAGIQASKGFGNGLRIGLGVQWQQRLPLSNTSFFTWHKQGSENFTANYPEALWAWPWQKHQAVLANASIRYKPGLQYIKKPGRVSIIDSDWPTLHASFTKGIPGVLGSKVDFDKWVVGSEGDVGMRMLGRLRFDVAAGGFLNDTYVAAPDLKHFRGNQYSLMYDAGDAFQLLPYYEYSNASPFYAEAHLEWGLEGLLTNKIPMFRKLQWYLVTGTNSFYAQPGMWYSEAFVGLDNIGWKLVRIFRIDAVKGWDSRGNSYFGIRVGLSANGPIRIGNSGGEW